MTPNYTLNTDYVMQYFFGLKEYRSISIGREYNNTDVQSLQVPAAIIFETMIYNTMNVFPMTYGTERSVIYRSRYYTVKTILFSDLDLLAGLLSSGIISDV